MSVCAVIFRSSISGIDLYDLSLGHDSPPPTAILADWVCLDELLIIEDMEVFNLLKGLAISCQDTVAFAHRMPPNVSTTLKFAMSVRFPVEAKVLELSCDYLGRFNLQLGSEVT